jgi:hypothetical protein
MPARQEQQRREHQEPASIPFPLVGCTDYAAAHRTASVCKVGFSKMAREYPSVLELVGNTPIVRLDSMGAHVEPRLLAKLEYVNPGGSVKDRIGLAMIE